MEIEQLKSILESLIFVSEEPVEQKQLSGLAGKVKKKLVTQALNELKEEYAARGGGIELVEIAGGYQFRTPAENAKWVGKLFESRPQRLTRASLETLAIVAYKQPLVRSDVERIRGVDSGGVLKTLLERELIKIVGRQDVPGRPVLYGTTDKFMEFFGLKSLTDLPPLRDITELGDAAEEFIAEYAEREGLPEAGIPIGPDGEEPGSEDSAEGDSGDSAEDDNETENEPEVTDDDGHEEEDNQD